MSEDMKFVAMFVGLLAVLAIAMAASSMANGDGDEDVPEWVEGIVPRLDSSGGAVFVKNGEDPALTSCIKVSPEDSVRLLDSKKVVSIERADGTFFWISARSISIITVDA